ncbi:alanine racemase [Escherichia coli]|uniref:Alanine racemase, biosynthetic n=1 Tax=Escherichia coli TaxID=562 RepID=A0A377DEN0_ECOLX|nr:alanine racemase [Escherichia coli]
MQAATVVINRRALRHNLQRLRELAPASKMVAVVKANAYGHGLLETARTLPDADAFGVARLEEALRLRAGGITKPVLLLEGFFDARDLPTISAQHFHTAVHNEEQLAALEEASLDEPVTVWMKLDTGMHRLGVRPEQAETFYHRLTQCKNVRQPVNIVSHFARADEPKCGATRNNSLSLIPFAKANLVNVPLPHRVAFCCGHSRILTGCARASFFMASLRWKIAPPVPILAVSQ